MTDEFDNPADALRARILGQLCCAHCVHMKRGLSWCAKDREETFRRTYFRKYTAGDPVGYSCYCHEFSYSPTPWKER